MESAAATELSNQDPIFKACNLELGIMIEDNDSTSISAIRAGSNHDELTANSIKYLKRCFTYCVSQNTGNATEIAAAIKNTVHSTIGNGFTESKLFDALKRLFNTLTSKTDRYAAGVSSNANESLNTIIASKAPKTRFYGGSASYDARLAFAINKKNTREKSANRLSTKLSLSTSKYSAKYYRALDSRADKRYVKSLSKDFKRKRMFLKKKKKKLELRHKKEAVEGPATYQSDVGLLSADAPPILNVLDNINNQVVGFSKEVDILQIAAKCGDKSFSIYINPSQRINEKASDVTGLREVEGKLKWHRKPQLLYQRLCKNFINFYAIYMGDAFDRPRLLAAIGKTFLVNHYKTEVYGFADTLPLIKKATGITKKGENKFKNLANLYNISTANVHNAISDVTMLEQVMIKLGISSQKIRQHFVLQELEGLKSCTSLVTRKKIVAAHISYESIIQNYKDNKLDGLINLFGENENGLVAVIKSRPIVKTISEFLEKCLVTSSQ
ncbi:hypothetical protein TSAR_007231 [Trichomalopsis sarcophagae]|uniref:Exonuclease domain-containing protein n=1 Tax=Trichomalopsis sarcophagae TaxID=543379 RepID=A0A232EJP9_9HYME|nr:hypothetical protein TSAR_007231 [Trichomalopsis sarcophagae]